MFHFLSAPLPPSPPKEKNPTSEGSKFFWPPLNKRLFCPSVKTCHPCWEGEGGGEVQLKNGMSHCQDTVPVKRLLKPQRPKYVEYPTTQVAPRILLHCQVIICGEAEILSYERFVNLSLEYSLLYLENCRNSVTP